MLSKIQKYLTVEGLVTLENTDFELSGAIPFCWGYSRHELQARASRGKLSKEFEQELFYSED